MSEIVDIEQSGAEGGGIPLYANCITGCEIVLMKTFLVEKRLIR